LLSENWEHSKERGLKLKGMTSWPAVGEPK
jgi:hypothetical protein